MDQVLKHLNILITFFKAEFHLFISGYDDFIFFIDQRTYSNFFVVVELLNICCYIVFFSIFIKATLSVGAKYLDACTIQKYIPIWLVINGTFGLLTLLIRILVNIYSMIRFIFILTHIIFQSRLKFYKSI